MRTKGNKRKFEFEKFEDSKIENLLSINGGDGQEEEERPRKPRTIVVQTQD